LSDLPVSGQITAFAISGKRMIWLMPLTFTVFLGAGFVEIKKNDWLD
jgi:hypothetical protein